jgi:hypothetical protein
MVQHNTEWSHLSVLGEQELRHKHSMRYETHPRKREPREDGWLQGAEGVTASKLEKGGLVKSEKYLMAIMRLRYAVPKFASM